MTLSSYPFHVMHSLIRADTPPKLKALADPIDWLLNNRYGHSYLLMAARHIIMSDEVKTLSTYLGNIKQKKLHALCTTRKESIGKKTFPSDLLGN